MRSQECKAEEEVRGTRNCRRGERTPTKTHAEELEEALTESKVLNEFENRDHNPKLCSQDVHSAFSVYKQICDEKRKKETQQTITAIILKRVKPLQEQAQTGP